LFEISKTPDKLPQKYRKKCLKNAEQNTLKTPNKMPQKCRLVFFLFEK